MDLSKKKCIPCEGKIPPLTKEKVAELKKEISEDWTVPENSRLRREFFFNDYKQTMDFVNKAAAIAEEEGHHPVMHVYYSKVEVELWTHAINGLSENDFIMAAKIDKIR
jgi:4a-hydroxytetrahydrobiopterin dehydratase